MNLCASSFYCEPQTNKVYYKTKLSRKLRRRWAVTRPLSPDAPTLPPCGSEPEPPLPSHPHPENPLSTAGEPTGLQGLLLPREGRASNLHPVKDRHFLSSENPYYQYAWTFDTLPWWLSGKEATCQCRRCGFKPCVGKIPWRRKWQPTPIFLPEESSWTEEPGGLQSKGS